MSRVWAMLVSFTTLYGMLLLGAGAFSPQATAQASGAACVTFPETGKQVCDRFLEYWQANGGLAQQGLPLTDVIDEVNPTDSKTYKTQYFERARFELHPENQPPYDVLLGLLGREQYGAKYPGTPPPPFPGDPFNNPTYPQECATFPETGKTVCSIFLAYWREHGGLAQQGLPLTDVVYELNPTDGKPYPTQYFERARFEFHAENHGTPYVVLLGLLGREQLCAKYANCDPKASPSPRPSPSPSAPPRPGDIRYQDDFTDPASGWPRFDTSRLSGDYAGSSYVVTLKSPDDFLATNGPANLTDVAVEVEVTNLYNSPIGRFAGLGLICRERDLYNRYVFLIDSSNQAAIFRQEQGVVTRLIRTDTQVIKPAGEVNRLRIECVGDLLSFVVNDTLILEVRDSAFTAGRAGFAATPPFSLSDVLPPDRWAIIRFEHFIVRHR